MKKTNVNKADTLLFSLRFFLYYSVIFLILVHPGISVSFDRIGIMQWFIIIPIMAFMGFFPAPSYVNNFRKRCIVAGVLLVISSLSAGGFGVAALQPFFAGLFCFIITYLLFYHPRWGKLSLLEPFFLAWVCLRLLAFSRSSEDIAGQSLQLTQFLLVWTGVIFLFHSVVIYLILYPQSRKGSGKESAFFFTAIAAVFVLVLMVLPPDFINNSIVENLHPERMPERIGEDSERGIPMEASGRRNGRRTLPRDGNERRPGLRGVSEHNWHNRPGRGKGGGESEENRQYLVKVVASEREPVYMGNFFRGQLDPVQGFLVSADEPLNRLASERFFVTWFDHEWTEKYLGRSPLEVFSLSTLPQKYLPYQPIVIDPPIINEDAGPLRYIHQVVADTFVTDPLWVVTFPSQPADDTDRVLLDHYLEINLEEEDLQFFSSYLNKILEEWRVNRKTIIQGDEYLTQIFTGTDEEEIEPVNEHMEIIIAILTNFSKYQYNLNFDDEYSIESLKDFIQNSNEGDCVEFSNTLALLGRIAGIPSRVVTGYLVAEGLQTPAHLRGLSSLRARIPALQQFPFENLYMVTNLHSHSWTQFYIAGFGWLDFEATQFSIPPVGMGDFNTWDVVIPLLDQTKVFSNVRKFPWLAVLRAAGFIAVLALAGAYVLRYGRELVLHFAAQKGGASGARSLYLLLLARLAADGKPIKPASKTALEYSELFPGGTGTKTFALIYSELRWRQFDDQNKMIIRFAELKQEYYNIIKTTRRRGFSGWVKRTFNLRGLAYL